MFHEANFELLYIRETVITIDAIGTTQQIISAIEKGEGHFVLTVKKSNPLTYEELLQSYGIYEKNKKKRQNGILKAACTQSSPYSSKIPWYLSLRL